MGFELVIGSSKKPPQAVVSPVLSTAVVYIDANRMMGESIVFGLKQIDSSTPYHWYAKVADWLASDCSGSSIVVLRETYNGSGGLGAAHEIAVLKQTMPEACYAVISDSDDHNNILSYLKDGARGYLSTDVSLAVSVQILHLIMAGGVYFPPATLTKLMAQGPASASSPPSQGSTLLDLLTQKEILVAKKLCKGSPNKIIAYDLNMCESTVKVHVRTLLRKLGAKNRTEIAFITNKMFADAA